VDDELTGLHAATENQVTISPLVGQRFYRLKYP
jgi:hypothetical protein